MITTQQVMEKTGMSKSRCLQFARRQNLPRFGQAYMWDDDAVKLFCERIGKRGGSVKRQGKS